jgi:DNA-binding protein H-NS
VKEIVDNYFAGKAQQAQMEAEMAAQQQEQMAREQLAAQGIDPEEVVNQGREEQEQLAKLFGQQ